MSNETGSSVSMRNESTQNILEKTKIKFYDFLNVAHMEFSNFFHTRIEVLLEMFFFVQLVMLSIDSSFGYPFESIFKYLCIPADITPLMFGSLVSYYAVFTICTLTLFIYLTLFVYTWNYLEKDYSVLLVKVFNVLNKLINGVLFIPMLRVFLAPLRFSWRDYPFVNSYFIGESNGVFEFPLLICFVIGIILSAILFLTVVIDSLFFLPILRSSSQTKLLMSSPNGTFPLIFRIFAFAFVVLLELFYFNNFIPKESVLIVFMVFSTIIILALIRFTPFYQVWFNIYVIVAFVCFTQGAFFTVLFMKKRTTNYFYLSFILGPSYLLVSLTCVLLKYYFVYLLFKKKKIFKMNYLLCSSPFDVAIVSNVAKDNKIFEHFMEKHFSSSKNLVVYFIMSVINVNYHFASQLSKRAQMMSSKVSFVLTLNDEYVFYHFKEKLERYHEHGTTSTRVMIQLKKIKKMESKLKRLYVIFWKHLAKGSSSRMNYGRMAKVITSIEQLQSDLHKVYLRTAKKFQNSPIILRSFADFLQNFQGNLELARMYRTFAIEIELKRDELDEGTREGSVSKLTTKSTDDDDETKSKTSGLSSVVDEHTTTERVITSTNSSDHHHHHHHRGEMQDVQHPNGVLSIVSSSGKGSRESLKRVTLKDDQRTIETTSVYSRKQSLEIETESQLGLPTGTLGGPSNIFRDDIGDSKTIHSFLLEKIKKTKYHSVSFATVFLLVVFIAFVGGCILHTMMGVMIYFESLHFQSAIEKYSQISRYTTDASYLARVRQIALFDNISFDDSQIVSKLKYTCDSLIAGVVDIRNRNTIQESARWDREYVDFFLKDPTLNISTSKEFKENEIQLLVDAMTTYTQYCRDLQYYPNHVITNINRMKNDLKFSTIVRGEKALQKSFESMMVSLIINFQMFSNGVISGICTFLVIDIILMITLCVISFFLLRSFLSGIKNMQIIHKGAILRILKKLKKQSLKKNSRLHHTSLSTSVVVRFFISSLVFLLCTFVVFGIFTGLTISNNLQTIEGNSKVLVTTLMRKEVRFLHLKTLEFLNKDSTVFELEEMNNDVSNGIENLNEYFEILRYGGVIDGLIVTGIDRNMNYRTLLYTDCTWPENSTIDDYPSSVEGNDTKFYMQLECLSLVEQMNLFKKSALYLLKNHETMSGYQMHLWFEEIALLDEGRSEGGIGALQEKVSRLMKMIKDENLNQNTFNMNLFLVFFSIFTPVAVVLYLLIFGNSPSTLKSTMRRSKKVFLFLGRRDLGEKHIFNYLSGVLKNKILKKFKKSVDTEYEMLFNNFHNLAVLVLDREYNVLKFNNTARELFQFQKDVSKIRNFQKYISENSLANFKRYVKNGKFSFEIDVICKNHTLPIAIDLSFSKKVILAIIRNLENEKNKESLIQKEIRSNNVGKLLKQILPEKIVNKFQVNENTNNQIDVFENILGYGSSHKECTAIFADICNFTQYADSCSSADLVKTLNLIFSSFDDLTVKYDIEKIKTIGDAYFAVAGIPEYQPGHATQAMMFAIALTDFMKRYNEEFETALNLKIGLNTGSVTTGIIGKVKIAYDCFGSTINLASRMESYGIIGKIQVSRSTFEFLYSKYEFVERTLNIKGKGIMKTYVYTPPKDSHLNTGDVFTHKSSSFEVMKERELLKGEKPKIGSFVKLSEAEEKIIKNKLRDPNDKENGDEMVKKMEEEMNEILGKKKKGKAKTPIKKKGDKKGK